MVGWVLGLGGLGFGCCLLLVVSWMGWRPFRDWWVGGVGFCDFAVGGLIRDCLRLLLLGLPGFGCFLVC